MLLHAAVSVLMIAVSVLLVVGHLRAWRRIQESPPSDDEQRRFAWGQFRRRVQTSGMIGLAGVLIFVGYWIDQGKWGLIYWCGTILLVIWIMLLAVADMIATRIHFARSNRDNVLQQARMSRLSREAENRRKGQQDGDSANGSGEHPSAN